MASRGRLLAGLNKPVCEANGKVKKTNVSLPSLDFKQGKMIVYRLGNSSSFSIGIQANTSVVRQVQCLSMITLKSGQFEIHPRPKRLTVGFNYNSSRLSIVEADVEELNALVEMLEDINHGVYQASKSKPRRPVNRILHQQEQQLVNDENQPLNTFSSSSSVPSSEENQFLTSRSRNSPLSSRVNNSPSQICTKRKHTPFSSGTSSSFYGSGSSTTSPESLKRSALSPKRDDDSPLLKKNNLILSSNKQSSSSFYDSNSSSPFERKKIGLSKEFREKSHLARVSRSFSFKSNAKPSFTDDIQLTGFSNIGNTCYMNAILQSLLGIEPFAQDLCIENLLLNNPAQSLYKCMYGLLVCKKKSYSQDLQSLHLRKFKRAISQAATRFSGHLQHDAHEFLCQVLDQLKDDVVAMKDKVRKDCNPPESISKEKELNHPCPITRTFECAVMHTITCKGCGESVTKEEPLNDLSLDLPSVSSEDPIHAMKSIAIDKLIEDYFEDEELEYSCEECSCKQASISHKFSRLPRVLILHVKRYDFNKQTDRHAKKHNNINIKKFIDIGKLCTVKTLAPSHFEVKKVKLMNPVKTPTEHTKAIQSQDDFSNTPTPKVRRKLHQEFDNTPRRNNEPCVIDIESNVETCKDTSSNPHSSVQSRATSNDQNKSTCCRSAKVVSNADGDYDEHYKEVDETPLIVETSDEKDLADLPEEKQMEWALKESMKINEITGEFDMDCTDEEMLSAMEDNSETVGLKGGGVSDTDGNEQCVLIQSSDDSDHSGFADTTHSSSTRKHKATLHDSTDTSLDEDGVPNPKRDNSLCSLIDQQPVLNEFVDDLLIEIDSNTGSAKVLTKSPKNEKFIKSAASPFNAKFRPVVGNQATSVKEPSVRTPQSSYSFKKKQQLSRSEPTSSRNSKSLYSVTKDSLVSDYEEDDLAKAIQQSLKDQDAQCNDDEQMRQAIELSIQETKRACTVDQDIPAVDNVQDYESPQEDVTMAQNESVDSGFQGDEAMTYPYRLVSVVSHLGDKSSAGHYISDVYSCAKDEWTSYDDLTALKVEEHKVRYGHARDGYIFFYLYKQCVDSVQSNTKSINK